MRADEVEHLKYLIELSKKSLERAVSDDLVELFSDQLDRQEERLEAALAEVEVQKKLEKKSKPKQKSKKKRK